MLKKNNNILFIVKPRKYRLTGLFLCFGIFEKGRKRAWCESYRNLGIKKEATS